MHTSGKTSPRMQWRESTKHNVFDLKAPSPPDPDNTRLKRHAIGTVECPMDQDTFKLFINRLVDSVHHAGRRVWKAWSWPLPLGSWSCNRSRSSTSMVRKGMWKHTAAFSVHLVNIEVIAFLYRGDSGVVRTDLAQLDKRLRSSSGPSATCGPCWKRNAAPCRPPARLYKHVRSSSAS